MTAPDTLALVPKVRARLLASVSGYVLTKRFPLAHRGALKAMQERGEVEVFESPFGNAYRLTQKGKEST